MWQAAFKGLLFPVTTLPTALLQIALYLDGAWASSGPLTMNTRQIRPVCKGINVVQACTDGINTKPNVGLHRYAGPADSRGDDTNCVGCPRGRVYKFHW